VPAFAIAAAPSSSVYSNDRLKGLEWPQGPPCRMESDRTSARTGCRALCPPEDTRRLLGERRYLATDVYGIGKFSRADCRQHLAADLIDIRACAVRLGRQRMRTQHVGETLTGPGCASARVARRLLTSASVARQTRLISMV